MGMVCIGRHQQQLGGVGSAAGDHHHASPEGFHLSKVVHNHFGDGGARRIGVQLDDLRVGQQRDVRVLERRADTDDFRVGFGMNEARKSVAVGATHASAVGHILLVKHNAARRVEWMITGPRQVIGQFLNARLV